MKEKINNIEFSSTLFLILFSCTLGIAPYITIKIAGIDSYIGSIIGSIIGLIPLFIFIYIFNYEIDKPIYQKTKIIFGNTLGTIINIFLTILYFILAITILFNTSNFIISQYLTDTPIKLVIIILSLTAYHTSNKGITTISKISLIYTLIIIILFIMATIGLIPEIELDNLKPVLEYGIKNPIIAGMTYSLVLTIPISSLLIIPKKGIENYYKTTKYIIITYLVTTIMIIFMSLVACACLGRYLISMYQYPVYITLKKISIFGFIDRIENFLSIEWILSTFVAFTLPIINIQSNINKKNNKIINLIIIIIIIIATMILFKNNTSFNHYLDSIYPYILLIILIIYIIIFITIIIKKGIKKKN